MIRSMTAFSHQESVTESGKLNWEIRTVNHRYLDIGIRLPEEFRAHENTYRQLIQSIRRPCMRYGMDQLNEDAA